MGVGQNGVVPGRGRNRAGRSGNRAGLKAGWGGAGRGRAGLGCKAGEPGWRQWGYSLKTMRIPRMKRTPAMMRPPTLRD